MKRLVLVGAGHVHLSVLKHLDIFTRNGHQVTVVSPGPYHYYSGMGPGILSGRYPPEAVRFHVKQMTEDRGGRFVEDRVIAVDPLKRRIVLASGDELVYNVVSFNIGSRIAMEGLAGETVFPVKPIETLLDARKLVLERIKKGRLKLWVAGGGPAGVEIAAGLRELTENAGGHADITLLAGGGLLAHLPERIQSKVRRRLSDLRVRIWEGARIMSCRDGWVSLSGGRSFESDATFLAVGTTPPPLFRDSGLPSGNDGGLLVNACLQSPFHPEIFGGGDCIMFMSRPLARVGVYAVRENPVLLDNLQAAMAETGAYRIFRPQKNYLLILNLGFGRGIMFKGRWTWEGRTALRLKDAIDRSFMKQFQVSGEALCRRPSI